MARLYDRGLVRRESTRRLWLLVAAYPVLMLGVVLMILGTLDDSDNIGPYESFEHWYIRYPIAVIAAFGFTVSTWLRVRELRNRHRRPRG